MTTATDERTVVVTVKEAAKQPKRGDFPPDYKLIVEAPWFQSQKPTVIYVPLDVGAGIEPGDTLSMVIRSKGIKDHDPHYDGQKPWMHNWAFVRLASTEPSNGAAGRSAEAAAIANDGAAAAPQSEAYQARKDAALAPDPRGNSIERQVALIQANLLAVNGLIAPDNAHGIVDTVEAAADRFIAWLQGTTAPDTGGETPPASTVEVRDLPFDPSQEP